MATRRDFEADVFYAIWRSGGNPDAVSYDRLDDAYYGGQNGDDFAASEMRRQRRRHEDEAEVRDAHSIEK